MSFTRRYSRIENRIACLMFPHIAEKTNIEIVSKLCGTTKCLVIMAISCGRLKRTTGTPSILIIKPII